MRKSYLELEIATNPKNYESVYILLYLEGIKTIAEENGVVKVCLSKYQKKKAEKLKQKLLTIKGVTDKDLSVNSYYYHNWDNEWKNSIEPVYVKDKIIVFPSWKKKELNNANGKILIEIDPKMSFGTGHNETTQLMLEMMCDHLEPEDKYLLDYGCGSGILAIAGIKLGVKSVAAIDIDNDSIENANEYILKNNTDKYIKLYKSDITGIKEKGFDVIVSNIDHMVITKNLKHIRKKLKTSGKLFITGILTEKKDKVVKKLNSHGFELIESRKKAEWLAFYAVKK